MTAPPSSPGENMSTSPYPAEQRPVTTPEQADVISAYRTCEFATVSRSGTPIAWPVVTWQRPDGAFVLTTSIAFPQKAYNIRRTPQVALLFSDATASGLADPPQILVQGIAILPGRDHHRRLFADGVLDAVDGPPAVQQVAECVCRTPPIVVLLSASGHDGAAIGGHRPAGDQRRDPTGRPDLDDGAAENATGPVRQPATRLPLRRAGRVRPRRTPRPATGSAGSRFRRRRVGDGRSRRG